jgi:peroxiredoxin
VTFLAPVGAANKSMALPVGTKAPDFTLPTKTADGPKQITLSDNFGKTNTVLLFFPMAFTGTCTTEMCGVSEDLSAYEKLNASIYGISGDNPFAQEAWAQKEKITIPLLSDYEHHVAREYDVAYESFLPQINLPMGGVPKRAVFIIDRAGVIQYAECNDDARALPDFEKIKTRLAELK